MSLKRLMIVAVGIAAGVGASSAAQAAECIGNCGRSGPNGVVAVAPTGDGSYDWVSTSGGQAGAGQIAGVGGTNGSELRSDTFFAAAGQQVAFWFNYVTSDGSGFADYGFSQLINTATSGVTSLFTARTQPSGTIAPGFGLPSVEANLSPAAVPIIPGGPAWEPLGGFSGRCYDLGCGYTGWIYSTYEVQEAGTYQLRFGVSNWSDQNWDTGMAFSGLLLDGATIGDGSSPTDPLLPTGEIGPNGEFEFTFTPTPGVVTWIDPDYAEGYSYEVAAGDNAILSAIFPKLSFDTDGYDVYTLDGLTLLASNVWDYDFGALGVNGFKLLGIDYALGTGVDPTDPVGFVTGLTYLNGNTQTTTQTPIVVTVNDPSAVPEPSTWAIMVVGFGAMGAAMRRRKPAFA